MLRGTGLLIWLRQNLAKESRRSFERIFHFLEYNQGIESSFVNRWFMDLFLVNKITCRNDATFNNINVSDYVYLYGI